MELEYTTDGTTWNNALITYSANPAYVVNNSTSPNTVNGTYFYETGGQGWYNDITANLSGITPANADLNFGIRIVNAATGADDVAYNNVAYNNNSGNVRYDNVEISGTAVPEPTSLALVGLGLAGLIARRKARKA
jgi:hypothetical protein